ncbi:hypothetical protein [Amycolatopsis sp. MEPSY49]|uniref:hypothetical protein n=1 Tax=Amycolatopsis sp. MEPSY49 TaxID=3151600 RepID=UPI003EF6DBFB
MAASAVPPTRLADRTRAAVREVLLAELSLAGRRALAAGCSRETLFEVLDARLRSVAEDVCGQPNPAVADGRSPNSRSAAGCAAPDSADGRLAPVHWVADEVGGRPARRRPAAEDACGQPDPAAVGRFASPPSAGEPGCVAPDSAGWLTHPRSAAEDRQHRRDDPLQPGLVGEGGD